MNDRGAKCDKKRQVDSSLGDIGWLFHYNAEFICLFVCLFGVLRRFQHCTGHITTGSWKGRGNQYIEFARVVYCKLLTNGKQLPAFPLEPVLGSNPGLRGGRRECYHSATVAPYNAEIFAIKDFSMKKKEKNLLHLTLLLFVPRLQDARKFLSAMPRLQ